MAKVMLVEDDNNLREIYEARLLAEGYEIVSARDGEEALALAVKEKPDLIISDIMMPKISGFDMLDILRTTPETKNTKVIMMTALSQAEDKDRADKLGADRYLVKSQVTLEDVARVAREVLDGTDGPVPAAVAATDATAAAPATPQDVPVTPAPDPAASSSDSNGTVLADTVAAVSGSNSKQLLTDDQPAKTTNSDDNSDAPKTAVGSQTSTHDKVIKPINDLSKTGPNLDELLAKEEAKEAAGGQAPQAPVVGQMDEKPPVDPGAAAL
jgi:CheY-like chemotaxis protein